MGLISCEDQNTFAGYAVLSTYGIFYVTSGGGGGRGGRGITHSYN